jgi:hypothetical protein
MGARGFSARNPVYNRAGERVRLPTDTKERERFARRERRMAHLRLALIIAAIVLSAVFVRYIFVQSNLEVKRILERQRAERYTLQLETPRMKGFNVEGEKVWDIAAESVSIDETRNIVTFLNTTATFYDEGEESLSASVGRLEYNRDTRNMELMENIEMRTVDDVDVLTTRVVWLDYYQRFIFPEGAKLVTHEGNYIKSDYMQSDKKLDHLEAVGHVFVWVGEMKDMTLIEKHELTREEVDLKEFKNVTIVAEKVLYDRKKQVVLATSRHYPRAFRVMSPGGREVKIEDYQPEASQLFFKKKEVEIFANHLEVHIDDKWARAKGNITGKILPSAGEPDEDKALRVMRRERTWFTTDDVEYYWGEDYVRTYAATTVVQNERLAKAGEVTYFGKYHESGVPGTQRAMFIEKGIELWQESGEWMFEEELLEEVKEEELKKIFREQSDVSAENMVVFLNRNDFHATGGVAARQENRTVRANEILYTDENKKFIANGNAYFVDKEGQEFYGQQIIYFSEAEDIEVNGASTATIKIPEKYRDDVDRALSRIKGERESEEEEQEEAAPEAEAAESEEGESAQAEAPAPAADDEDKAVVVGR